jgi:hypothetical protein
MDRRLSSASRLKRLFVQDNHLIEHLATDIGHESFGVWILPSTARCGDNLLDALDSAPVAESGSVAGVAGDLIQRAMRCHPPISRDLS